MPPRIQIHRQSCQHAPTRIQSGQINGATYQEPVNVSTQLHLTAEPFVHKLLAYEATMPQDLPPSICETMMVCSTQLKGFPCLTIIFRH